ncbi:Uncharacterized protein FWK35_00002816 [Aphis craccivora]|uniref:Uncharacterized protein n=1 Tax=Aphis craccivora TaxID=307492 RepID=A0A6G0Z2T0_APHCR|nr:Uncharacterized protein FWK35_00002816 [Aphis craccivora]
MQCKFRFHHLIDTEILIFNEHNHKPLLKNILTRPKINNNLKRKSVDDMFIRSSKILHSELKNDNIENITSGDVLLIKINVHCWGRRLIDTDRSHTHIPSLAPSPKA